jgi:hypothetical protein
VKVTHENAPPPKAEEKRKKSNVAGCYLKDFNMKFVPELIKRVSDNANPWQPTFDTDSVIEKIRHQVYPNVTEEFEGKDPLFAPVSHRPLALETKNIDYLQAFAKVTYWRAAIGRRAIGVVKTYLGDKSIFGTTEEVEEHVQWLLPDKDEETDEEDEGKDNDEDKEGGIDEEDNVDVEEIVRRRKKRFVGAPFLYQNGLIGPAKEPVRLPLHMRSALTLLTPDSRQDTS